MALARVLHEAREELGRQWSALWRSAQIPISKRQADKLVTIGRELGGLSEHNCAQLPPHRSVLYQIALLGRDAVVHFVAEGVIHPGLSLGEAKALRRVKTRDVGPSIAKALRRLEEMVRRAGLQLSRARRAACAAALNRLAAEILLVEPKEG